MWSEDIETILDGMRMNSIILHKEHRKQYFKLKHSLRYYRVPVIVISAVSSIASVGLNTYLPQKTISMATCILGLLVSIIGSVEMYLHIQQSMENEMVSSREFQLLSIELYKILSLSVENRPPDARQYLEKAYDKYVKLLENSEPLLKKLTDKMTPIEVSHQPRILRTNTTTTPTSSDSEIEIVSSPSPEPYPMITSVHPSLDNNPQHQLMNPFLSSF